MKSQTERDIEMCGRELTVYANEAKPSSLHRDGSLPASSVKKLLKRWETDLLDWKQSVESWQKVAKTESDIVRLNRCEARCRMLETVIGELRAEMASTNKRQPVENDKLTDGGCVK